MGVKNLLKIIRWVVGLSGDIYGMYKIAWALLFYQPSNSRSCASFAALMWLGSPTSPGAGMQGWDDPAREIGFTWSTPWKFKMDSE